MHPNLAKQMLEFLEHSIDDAQWAEKHGVDLNLQKGRIDAYKRVQAHLLYLMEHPHRQGSQPAIPAQG
ncbi:MAG: hypothetical protein KF754_08335 [Planctomycetes bacterium]|nr:hypothetical protein [Planctomycetota bacterium]